jgi:hypothetical protein
VGTTNDTAYLKYNNTRRYWPVRAGVCDVAGLVAARDQLWAEACALEAQGTSIRLDRSLWDVAAAEQAKRRVEDPVMDVLGPGFEELTGKIRKTDVWKLLGFVDRQPSTAEATNITRVMTELGWDNSRLSFHGTKAYAYARGNDAQREQAWHLFGGQVVPWPAAKTLPDRVDRVDRV